MAKTKEKSIVAKVDITCYEDNECEVNIDGNESHIIASFAALLNDDSEDNAFNELITTAMAVVLKMRQKAK